MNGWTCTVCNSFVAWGANHSCPGYQQQPTPPVTDLRIAAALERIAASLERLVVLFDPPIDDEDGNRYRCGQ